MKIPTVDQCRYLDITISTNNSDIDSKRQMRKMYANILREKVSGPPYYKHWITHMSRRDFQRSCTLDWNCLRYMNGLAYGMT